MNMTLRSLPLVCASVLLHSAALRAQDGLPDLSFTPQLNGDVQHIAVQPDGRLIIVGDFTMVNGTTQNHIARLHADGTLDDTFNSGTAFGAVADVRSIAITASGQYLVAASSSPTTANR